MRFQDSVAIVTGAGSGIGRATAEAFAREGAAVVASDLDLPSVEETLALIQKAGGRGLAIACDVSDAGDIQRMVDAAVVSFQRIDIVVNNAGTGVATLVDDLQEDQWDRVLDVNLKGMYLVIRAVVPQMKRQGSGRIVNVASVEAIIGLPGHSAYAASKAGVTGLTRSLAIELAPHKIQVNYVCPGATWSAMTMRWFKAAQSEVEAGIPMGRIAQPSEIAAPILFLCSEDASFITGQGLVIDGGLVAR